MLNLLVQASDLTSNGSLARLIPIWQSKRLKNSHVWK